MSRIAMKPTLQPELFVYSFPVRVYFAAGGGNREVCVLHLRVGTVDLTVDELVRQHGVSERDVGRWIRAAVDAALDRAR